MRRKDKEITNLREMKENLKTAHYVTLTMCLKDGPYVVTINHGFDQEKNCIYFHCAEQGKQIYFLKENNLVLTIRRIDIEYMSGKRSL